MSVDLFAGLPVTDYARSVAWYEQLLGCPPTFFPNDVEAVWEVAEHRYVYIEHLPDRAGRGMVTLFVDDLDDRLAAIAVRGLTPDVREAYENDVRKLIFRDPDGNEIGFGGGPQESSSTTAERLKFLAASSSAAARAAMSADRAPSGRPRRS